MPAIVGGARAGHDDEVVGGQRRPARRRADGGALRGADVFLLGDVVQVVFAPEVGGGAKRLGRPGQVEQVHTGDEQEDDSSHDLVNAAGPSDHFLDGGDGGETAGQRVLGSLDHRAGGQRARIRQQLFHRLFGRRVTMPDRVGRGGLGDERDLVAEVGRHPRGGLAALLGPDAADDELGDCALREQLLQAGRGERVMRGLDQDGLPVARRQRLDEADVPAGRVEYAAGARLGVQDPHDKSPPARTPSTRRATSSAMRGLEMACQSGRWRNDSWTSMTMSARVMSSSILVPLAGAKGRIRSRCGSIRSHGGEPLADRTRVMACG